MAFDHDGFFAIVGQYVKPIDVFDGYIDVIETRKGTIQDIFETENVPDLYTTVPGIFAAMQGNVTTWINTLIADLQRLFVDRSYVLEQLPSNDRTTTGILNALYDYMLQNSETIQSSVVSLDGADVDLNASTLVGPDIGSLTPRLFVSRTLDGVSNPGNGVQAHIRYSGIESQLARSTTVYAKTASNALLTETAQVYSAGPETGPYVLEDEEPATGPLLNTVEVGNLVGTNYNFSAYTTNVPNNWTPSGGTAPGDFLDNSGTGVGPLRVNTVSALFYKQITNLTANKLYFFGVLFRAQGTGGETSTVAVRLRTLAGTTIGTQRTAVADQDDDASGFNHAYGFVVLPSGTNLTDVYLEVKYNAESDAGQYVLIYRAVVTPAVYWNGLGWAWWATTQVTSLQATVGQVVSLTVANNDAGVFQRFFRKAYNVQLPTADAPTIPDSLAT